MTLRSSGPHRGQVPSPRCAEPIRRACPGTLRAPTRHDKTTMCLMRLATWNVNSIRSRADRVAAFLQRQRRRRPGSAGDQVPGRPVPRDDVQRDRVRGRARRLLAVERRRDHLPRRASTTSTVGFPGQPHWGEDPSDGGPRTGRHLRRRPGVEPVRAERPHARRSAPHLQAGLARGAADDGRRLARRRPGRADRPGRRLEHRAAGRRRVGHERVRPLDARLRARAGGLPGRSSTPGSPTSSGPSRPGPASTRTGTTSGCASRAARACGSTSSSSSPALAARTTGALIDREERKGKGASDHAPVIVELAD